MYIYSPKFPIAVYGIRTTSDGASLAPPLSSKHYNGASCRAIPLRLKRRRPPSRDRYEHKFLTRSHQEIIVIMFSSFRSIPGDLSEEEAYSPSFYEEPVHEDLHTTADALKLAQDLGFAVTDPTATVIGRSSLQTQCGLQTKTNNDSDLEVADNSSTIESNESSNEGIHNRRASSSKSLCEFQAGIKALMEDMYKAKISNTGNHFVFHYRLSDRASRALFGLYGKIGDSTIEPSWLLFPQKLFNTDDNLSLATAYPAQAQKAIQRAMEMLWSPTHDSLEQVLRSIRAELAPEPASVNSDLFAPAFDALDSFGRFLVGFPQPEIDHGIDSPPKPDGHQPTPDPALYPSGTGTPSTLQGTAQTQSQAQPSKLMPGMAQNAGIAVAVVAATTAPAQLTPASAQNVFSTAPASLQIQALPAVPQNIASTVHPPQIQAPLATAHNGGAVIPPPPRQRFRRIPRAPRAPLVPRNFYSDVAYNTYPAGYDYAHNEIIALQSLDGIPKFSNGNNNGPIAKRGNLAGDFLVTASLVCVNDYLRRYHPGTPLFGGGRAHGSLWNWYRLLSPFEDDRFRKFVMAMIEAAITVHLPNIAIQIAQARQPPVPPLGTGPNIPLNVAPITNAQAIVNAPIIPAPTLPTQMTNHMGVGLGGGLAAMTRNGQAVVIAGSTNNGNASQITAVQVPGSGGINGIGTLQMAGVIPMNGNASVLNAVQVPIPGTHTRINTPQMAGETAGGSNRYTSGPTVGQELGSRNSNNDNPAKNDFQHPLVNGGSSGLSDSNKREHHESTTSCQYDVSDSQSSFSSSRESKKICQKSTATNAEDQTMSSQPPPFPSHGVNTQPHRKRYLDVDDSQVDSQQLPEASRQKKRSRQSSDQLGGLDLRNVPGASMLDPRLFPTVGNDDGRVNIQYQGEMPRHPHNGSHCNERLLNDSTSSHHSPENNLLDEEPTMAYPSIASFNKFGELQHLGTVLQEFGSETYSAVEAPEEPERSIRTPWRTRALRSRNNWNSEPTNTDLLIAGGNRRQGSQARFNDSAHARASQQSRGMAGDQSMIESRDDIASVSQTDSYMRNRKGKSDWDFDDDYGDPNWIGRNQPSPKQPRL
ncbi:hypothetical protein N431DRAFT_534704 [Stipitochalara longipes BDJ]|nr:hypothetical protein N431DRAFT_534704 [Stipitochalara longipes BDJ]